MHWSIIITALIGAGFSLADDCKANEYKSGDCSGAINYHHTEIKLDDVTMDGTSHSVYINNCGVDVYAYSGKTGNGGSCSGSELGIFGNGCHNLDHPAGIDPGRVNCVRFTNETP